MNTVQIIFDGDATPLMATVDRIAAKLKNPIGNIGGTVNVSTMLAAPIVKANTEIERSVNRMREKVEESTTRSQQAFQAMGGFIKGIAAGVGFATIVHTVDALIDRAIEGERATRLLSAAAVEAGISFSTAAEQNKAFAQQLGLSEKQAAATSAKIFQLASRAGRSQDAGKIGAGLADLSAAYGIDSRQLQDLIGSILSGQDEGLNRLGLPDPGKLYDAYAKSIGTTASNLTQLQKTQAAVNAVLDKSAQFSGTAADRMNSLDGQVAKAAAGFESLRDNIAQAFAQNPIVQEALKTWIDLLGGVSYSIGDVKKKLEEGVRPEDIAKQMSSRPGLTEYLQAGASALLSGGAIGAYLWGPGLADATDPAAIHKRNLQSLTDQIDAMARANKRNAAAAADNAEKMKQQGQVADATKNYLAGLRAVMSLASVPELRDMQKSLYAAGSPFSGVDAKDRSAFEGELKKRLNDLTEEGRKKAKELGENWNKAFSSAFAMAGSENPFVKIYTDGEQALKSFREQTVGLTEDLRKQGEMMIQGQTQLALFKERMDTGLTALGLRETAQEFRAGGSSESLRKIADDQAKAAIQRYIEQSRQGLLRNSRAALSPFAAGTSAAGRLELFDFMRREDERTGLFRNPDYQDAIRAQIARQEDESTASGRLRRQLAALGSLRPGTDAERSALDAKVLSLAGNVDPATLRTDQRNQIAAAAERQAERVERRQQEALDLQKKSYELQKDLHQLQKRFYETADKSGIAGVETLIKIQNDATADVRVRESLRQPTPDDTNRTYSLGTFGGDGGLTSF